MLPNVSATPGGIPAGPDYSLKKLGNWWVLFLLVLAFGIGLRIWLYATTDFTVGDAFISFRFAEQFAAGNGLVFNAGEWAGGNTSPLHSFLLGLGACTGLGVPLVARIEGSVFDIISFFLMWSIFRRTGCLRTPLLQVIALAVIFLCPFLFWYSVSGLETPLYLMAIFYLIDRTLKGVDWQWYLAVTVLLIMLKETPVAPFPTKIVPAGVLIDPPEIVRLPP